MPRSKRIVKEPTVSKTGVIVETAYCRRCMQTKKVADFFAAVDLDLDRNGYFSICRDCANEICNNYYKSERNVPKAIYRACKAMNLKYDETALEALNGQLKTMYDNNKNTDNLFGIYKAKLATSGKGKIGERNLLEDFTFNEYIPIESIHGEGFEENEDVDLRDFWGENYNYDEVNYLER